MDVLVEVALVVHREPGAQTSTGIVNARVSGRSRRKMMEGIALRHRVTEIPDIVSKDSSAE